MEFVAAVDSLDIIGVYSYFYVNCAQKVYREVAAVDVSAAQSFYVELLSSLSQTLTSTAYLSRVLRDF